MLALADAPRAGRGHGLSPAVEAKIVQLTVQTNPPAPLTHWSTRRLAAKVGVHYSTVAAVWKRHGLKPHRLERYKASPDPDFETKAADIIGLYVEPPQHAVVFCIDEKTAIQALDRTDPVLPLSPVRISPKLITRFGPKRSPVSVHGDQPFRRMSITGGRMRTRG